MSRFLTTATLTSLPHELLDQITDNIGPDDIESYALVCKKLFEHAAVALQTHRSKSRYARTTLQIYADVPGSPLTREWESHPCWFLRAILDHPELVPYVTHLTLIVHDIPESVSPLAHLAPTEDFAGVLEGPENQHGESPAQSALKEAVQERLLPYQQRILNLLQCNHKYFQEDEYTTGIDTTPDWYAKAMEGERTTIVGLILLLLKDIQHLTVLNCVELPLNLQELMWGIIHDGSTPRESRPLSKVSGVAIGILEPTGFLSTWSTLQRLAQLPSVRTVKGFKLERLHLAQRLRLPSHIESIVLDECDVAVSEDLSLYGEPQALKRFSMTLRSLPGNTAGCWNAVDVTHWLCRHAARTLRELTLVFRSNPQPTKFERRMVPMHYHRTGSLKRFKQLQYAKLMIDTFYPSGRYATLAPPDQPPTPLVEVLPYSLKTLVLCGDGRAGMEEGLLGPMIQSGENPLPNLKRLVFEIDPQLSTETIHRLRSIGVEVIVESQGS
ncbi:MAG: hypothetical protein L6R39_004067 [Caloplaca ligustica]|nr:MAG: hypothetical protein L6R39_004067 [Caloplaca ligustica]